MNWLSDTWREVTTGGKAKTKTYNGSSSAKSRPAAAPAKQQTFAPARQAPLAPTAPAPRAPASSGALSSSWRTSGTGEKFVPPAPRAPTPVAPRAPAPTAAQRATAQSQLFAGAQREARLGAGTPKLQLGPQTQAQRQHLIGQQAMQREDVMNRVDPTNAIASAENVATPAAQTARRAKVAQNTERAKPGAPRIRELTDEQYLALTPDERAAVQFNTGLVTASRADQAAGGDTNTRSYLSSLDLLTDGTNVDEYLRLDKAISDTILGKFAELSVDAPERGAATAAASALSRNLTSSGLASTSPGVATAAGYGATARDAALRQAYEFMVDARYQLDGQSVADGLAQLNQANGTDVTPQELWDFAGAQLQAVEYGRVTNPDLQVPVTNPEITPLSVEDIRARYGL